MKISEFDYDLPSASIALYPPKIRGTTRLLVLNRQTGAIEHKVYTDLVNCVAPGDVVVLNNTRVIKARLQVVNQFDQPRELLLLETHQFEMPNQHQVMYRGKIGAGEILSMAGELIKVEHILDGGLAVISSQTNLLELADKHGSVPLPPYIKRKADEADAKRYQTEFAKSDGSVAAPTASLNFTKELIAKLEAKGVKIVYLTLHVGLGTFLPIRSGDVEGHHMHSEYFEIPEKTVKTIQEAKSSVQKVVAIGTTVARTLEYASESIMEKTSRNLSGEANIFIYPGYKFQVVDSLLTNFHAPRSTVLMLAAAFAGWDNLKHAYEAAINNGYKLLSYGDSMLIL